MKIAIIGQGIVGATLAYYLSKENKHEIDVYDHDYYSGTKAAVGIVCPWVSQRRNQVWYTLVEEGAKFYDKLALDLNNNSFMDKRGAFVIHPTLHDKLYELAKKRQTSNPNMGKVQEITSSQFIPKRFRFEKAIEITGAFRVDGESLLIVLKENSKINYSRKKAKLTSSTSVNQTEYDLIYICAGASTQDVLKDININLDTYAQKGILLEYDIEPNDYRIIMPKGEIDFLYSANKLVIGASHENEYEDMNFNQDIANNLIAQANEHLEINNNYTNYRIGLRSHNKENLPIFGKLNKYPHISICAGLGSSGLTSGPYIGYLLSQINQEIDKAYDPNRFID